MRILFVSLSPLRKEISIGNTFLNLFGDIEDVELASIYTRAGKFDSHISRGFCITEKMLVKNLLKKSPVGVRVEPEKEDVKNTEKEETAINFAKSKRWTVLFWIQNFIWRIGRWRSPELNSFIEEYNPDIVVSVLSNNSFLNRLILYVKSFSKAKLMLYAWDNNYSLKQFYLSPLRWIRHFINRVSMRKVVEKADLFYVISEIQKKDYEKIFKRECKILTKSADFDEEMSSKTEYNKPLQIVFTGNIGTNRWVSLSDIARTLEEINKDSVKAQLRIYTGTPLTDKMKKALNRGESSYVMGSVSADEIYNVQKDADILVHVEGKDLKNRLALRQSLSTKIVDYLKMARPILAYGPKEVASIDYFIRNDCAIVAEKEDELAELLSKAIEDKTYLELLSKKAYECGRKNHNKKDIDTMLLDDLK